MTWSTANRLLLGTVVGVLLAYQVWGPSDRLEVARGQSSTVEAVLVLSSSACKSQLYLAGFLRWPTLRESVELTTILLDPAGGKGARDLPEELALATHAQVRYFSRSERRLLKAVSVPPAPALLLFDKRGHLRHTWQLSDNVRERNMIVKDIQTLAGL